jgi:hypothetical protein
MLKVNVSMACVCRMEQEFQKIQKEHHVIVNCQLIKEMLMVNVDMAGSCRMEQEFQKI